MYELLLDQENRTWGTQPQGSRCMTYCQIKKIEPGVLNISLKMYKLLLDQENRTWRTQPQGSKCMPELLLDQENKIWRPHPQGSKCMNYCQIKKIEPSVLNIKAQNV